MKTVLDPKEYKSVLAVWRGAQAKIWAYHVSRKRMAINLSRAEHHDALYVVGIGCEHFFGPFRWDRADISIVTDSPNQWGEIRHHILEPVLNFL